MIACISMTLSGAGRPRCMAVGVRAESDGPTGILLVALFLLAMTAVTPVSADWYTYVKAGPMDVDKASSNPLNLALDLGYDLDTDFADMSLVAEINRTVDRGHSKDGGDLEFESNGLYLVFRSTRSLFATFSVGAVDNKTIDDSGTDSSSGLAFGGSVGIVIGRTRLKIEYTSIAGEANFFSIGLAF